jgi:hypothetical protein
VSSLRRVTGAVVDHLAVLVAPRRVVNLSDGKLRDIARDDAIDELCRIAPVHDVFEQRRHVDQRRCVANRVVFVLVMRFVRAHRVIAGPLAKVQRFRQRERPLVDGRANWHGSKL